MDFETEPNVLYPVGIHITAVDRYHLLRDIIHCIVEDHKLPLTSITMGVKDELFTCDIRISVHSVTELNETVLSLASLEGVDQIKKERF